MESKKKKNGANELIHKTEIESQMGKTNLWLPVGKAKGRDNLGDWIDIYTQLYIK